MPWAWVASELGEGRKGTGCVRPVVSRLPDLLLLPAKAEGRDPWHLLQRGGLLRSLGAGAGALLVLLAHATSAPGADCLDLGV